MAEPQENDSSGKTQRITEIAPGAASGDEVSLGSLSIEGASGMTIWSAPGTTSGVTAPEIKVQLHPEQPIVIGRQEGGEIHYLDPHYRPTQMVPNAAQSVLNRRGTGKDRFVSRGHFMLRGNTRGIVLVNGVPRRGGGIRPPLNGTRLLAPAYRPLQGGEELLIEKGTSVKIHLPNDTVILINAE